MYTQEYDERRGPGENERHIDVFVITSIIVIVIITIISMVRIFIIMCVAYVQATRLVLHTIFQEGVQTNCRMMMTWSGSSKDL